MTNEKTIQVCLLGASLNTGNLGVSALASGLTYWRWASLTL